MNVWNRRIADKTYREENGPKEDEFELRFYRSSKSLSFCSSLSSLSLCLMMLFSNSACRRAKMSR